MNAYINTKKDSALIKYLITFLFFTFGSLSILQAEVKIMPLGDSITWDWYYTDSRSDAYRHGYRDDLWYKLQDADYSVDFVGSRHNGGAVSPSYDGHNQAYTGWTSHQIADNMYGYLGANTPDIILLHIGTNDSAFGSTSHGVAGVERILNEIDRFENNKDVKIKVILAQIINLQKNPSWITSFNNKLVTMAQQRIANKDDIVLVNMHSAVGGNLIDRIHPNTTGYAKMATVWFNALKPALDDLNNNYAWLIPIQHIILNP